jgi:diguanylate cyclase (GGDEF)-like protein
VEVFRDNSQKLMAVQRATELQRVALLDPLTGLPNRRYIEMNLAARFDEMERYEWAFGVLFMDIDHFKEINDRYGHDVGDRVLKMVSRTLVHSTRPFDLVGRWGGEEFVGIATNVDFAQLKRVANRFRILVQQSSLTVGDFEIRVTISVGATLAQGGDSIDTLVKRADLLMYRSKASGRNRVTMIGSNGEEM